MSKPHAVVRQTDGHVEGCHGTEGEAQAQMRALMASEDTQKAEYPTVKLSKVDDVRKLVFGWASVVTDEQGRMVVDSDGEMIDPAELEDAVYDYVLKAREAGQLHEGDAIGRMVESLVITPEKAGAMGLPDPAVSGWWVGMKIDDPEAFAKVKDGTYRMFSIWGSAEREVVEA